MYILLCLRLRVDWQVGYMVSSSARLQSKLFWSYSIMKQGAVYSQRAGIQMAQSEVSEKARPSAVVEMKLRVWTSLMSSSNRDEVTAAARHRFTAQNKLLRL